MNQNTTPSMITFPGDLSIATAVDESYVMPAAVMLVSALRNLQRGLKARVMVLESGLSTVSKQRIAASIERYPATLEWLALDAGLTPVAPIARRPVAALSLLAVDTVVPADVRRLIYLDADTIVLGNLCQLWETRLNGALAAAAPDAYAHTSHASRVAQVQAVDVPAMPPDAPYFNDGVMLIDLEGWRTQGIGARARALITAHPETLLDQQDALNAVLQGRWLRLSPAWNVHQPVGQVHDWAPEGLTKPELAQVLHDPDIVHFVGSSKPWDADCRHLYEERFLGFLKYTPWRRWTPAAMPLVRRTLFQMLRRPHARIDWYAWNGLVRTRDREVFGGAVRTVARHPWTVVTYPVNVLKSGVTSWRRRQARRRDDRSATPAAGPQRTAV